MWFIEGGLSGVVRGAGEAAGRAEQGCGLLQRQTSAGSIYKQCLHPFQSLSVTRNNDIESSFNEDLK